VAIDRATRQVFIAIYRNKTAANARRFLRDLERACPIRIRTILTDGKEFTDRLLGLRKRAATGQHEFDRLCSALGIEHRLTPPRSPQTNGMVERFNGRIEDVL
jgi:transposase InsO family protein